MPFSYLYQITNLCQCLLNSSTVHTNVAQSFYSLKGCFLKASVLSVWAHAGLAGWFALLWCWPGLCMALHFISPADTQKQGAAWWPGCRSSSSQLQLHSLYSIVLIGCRFVTVTNVTVTVVQDLIFRLLRVGHANDASEAKICTNAVEEPILI